MRINQRFPVKIIIGGVILVCAVVAVIAGFSIVAADSARQEEEASLSISGYVTRYLDDERALWTDGTNTLVIKINEGTITQLPLFNPVTISVVVHVNDGGGLEFLLASVDEVGTTAPIGLDLPLTFVEEIISLPIDDHNVVVRGVISQHITGEKWLFSDGTGMIVLDINGDIPENAIPLNQTIDIFGQVDYDDGRLELDALGIMPASGPSSAADIPLASATPPEAGTAEATDALPETELPPDSTEPPATDLPAPSVTPPGTETPLATGTPSATDTPAATGTAGPTTIASPAATRTTGNSDQAAMTIAGIQENPTPNQVVTLTGQINGRVIGESNKYTFSDDSGTLVIEIFDSVADEDILLNTAVNILGVVDIQENGQPEIDVYRIWTDN